MRKKHLLAFVSILLVPVSCMAKDVAHPDVRFKPLRPPLFGLSIERHPDREIYRLISHEDEKKTLVQGTLETCESRLLKTLEKKFGKGFLNVSFPTFGGKQFWADQFVFCGWRIQQNVYTGHCRLLDPSDERKAWGTYEACRVAMERVRIEDRLAPRSDHLVLLVHGLFRSKDSFKKMAEAIEKEGYEVARVNYPSTRRKLSEHADQLETVLKNMIGVKQVSFVAHSLGGLVVRSLLARDSAWKKRLKVRGLVMLATPNRGSIVAKNLEDWLPYQLIAGKVGQQLTAEDVAEIPPPSCRFGIIAGGTGKKTGINPLLPGDNDSTVLVENAKLPGASDFMIVKALHSFIMNNDTAIEATLRFLKKGTFKD